ncbi:MAG: hypothetical protein WC775_06465 [Patescibacteria group bacterium]|jgi:hypothetical protein
MKKVIFLAFLVYASSVVYSATILPHIADNGFEGDVAGDWKIDDRELLYAINQWSLNILSDWVLLDIVSFWAANGYYFDNEAQVYKPINTGGWNENI